MFCHLNGTHTSLPADRSLPFDCITVSLATENFETCTRSIPCRWNETIPHTETGSGNYTTIATMLRTEAMPLHHTQLHTPTKQERSIGERGGEKKYNITETHSDCLMAPSVSWRDGSSRHFCQREKYINFPNVQEKKKKLFPA